MRLLTRYILREVLSHALLGGVLFTFVLFTSRLSIILEIVVRNSASLSDASRLVAYFLPEALIVTIPMAVLVGILLGLSRLAADSEITAMRAAGMGALDFVRIVSLVSIGALALGLVNSLYLAPRSAAALLALQDNLKYSQASFEVEPRVFDEDFKNIVLYVQDVRPGSGAALWRHVFVADLTEPSAPRITTAEQAIVTSAGPGNLNLHLTDGAQHQISATDPNQYNISTFHVTDIPMVTGAQEEAHLSRSDTRTLALSVPELLARMKDPPLPTKAGPKGPITIPFASPADRDRAARTYKIELNKRFSYPFACLVLMLVGVPLGLSSKRGGKSTGFVLTILLVFVYYFLSSVGVALANQGKLAPFLGVWGANILFAIAGALLLQQLSRGGVALSLFASLAAALTRAIRRLLPHRAPGSEQDLTSSIPQRLRSMLRIQFPFILDDYIMREFGGTFILVLTTFSLVFVIFTFFELIGDIIRNRIAFVTVGEYLLNLIPYIVYNVTPLCVLVAVLITFGALAKSSEFTAMKASGLSLYRVVTPVLVLTAVIAVALFAFDESYLPAANRRQEALRSIIKGKPAQTFLRPDRQWISGQTFPTPVSQALQPAEPHLPAARHADPARIFFYQFFDPDRNVFANLTVFEIDPSTFQLTRRIFASSAHWDPEVSQWILENGWSRTFAGEIADSFTPYTLSTFPEIREQPTYFKKEDRQSQQMSFSELSGYIEDLKQSGFDTKRLSVQLNRKLAYPAITLVMAILAVPFALMTGKRGGVAGFAIAILIAVVYLGVSGLFEAMGNVNTLPPTLAAWSADALFAFAGAYFLLRTPT